MFEITINDKTYNLNDLVKNKHNSIECSTHLVRYPIDEIPENYTCSKCSKQSVFKQHVRTRYASRRSPSTITFHLFNLCKSCRKAPKATIVLQSAELTDKILKYAARMVHNPELEMDLYPNQIKNNLSGRDLLEYADVQYSNPNMFRNCVADAFEQLMANTTAEQKILIFDYLLAGDA